MHLVNRLTIFGETQTASPSAARHTDIMYRIPGRSRVSLGVVSTSIRPIPEYSVASVHACTHAPGHPQPNNTLGLWSYQSWLVVTKILIQILKSSVCCETTKITSWAGKILDDASLPAMGRPVCLCERMWWARLISRGTRHCPGKFQAFPFFHFPSNASFILHNLLVTVPIQKPLFYR